MTTSTHAYEIDPRNADILISVNGELVARDKAVVSVFDSGFILGDGVWEGLRLHNGKLAFIDKHMERLWEGAKALDMDIGLSQGELVERLYETTRANGMTTGVHIRLMVTRGIKATPYQDPRATITSPTIVIIPEYKIPMEHTLTQGVRLFTVHVRRAPPDVLDAQINNHSKLNCILACIQATKAGFDEALMLDPRGYVATCNSTHFFIVRKGEVWTSSGLHCLRGITRASVIEMCHHDDTPVFEKDFSLTQVYSADEAFVTGTFAGLTPVTEVDGRIIGDGQRGPMTERLQGLFQALIAEECPHK